MVAQESQITPEDRYLHARGETNAVTIIYHTPKLHTIDHHGEEM